MASPSSVSVYVYEFFRILPVLITLCAVSFAVMFQSPFWAFMVVGILLNGILWTVIGEAVERYYPEVAVRPQTYHCYYIEHDRPAKSGGLPSGHSQTMSFVATWTILYLLSKRVPLPIAVPTAFVLVASTWFMMHSRADHYRCHTWFQTTCGSGIGIVTAIALWVAVYRSIPDFKP